MNGQAKERKIRFLAGVSEKTITPPVGAPLLGTIQRSDGAHDDLYARTLVLSDGEQKVAIICLDLIGMDFVLSDEIRNAIQNLVGIKNVLICCTHTHSSPFTIPWSVLGPRWLSGPGKQWRDGLAQSLSELVRRAAEDLSEVTLRAGRAPVQIGTNRRLPTSQGIVMKPYAEGPIVPWVDVLRVDRTDGTTAAILFSHAAHPVIIHGASRQVSADFPGFAAQKLKKLFGGKVMTLFAQSFGANINGDPLRGGFESAADAGDVLAIAAFQAASQSEVIEEELFCIKSAMAELALNPLPSREECLNALREAESQYSSRFGAVEYSDEELWDLQDKLGSAESQEKSSAANDVQPMAEQPWWLMDTILCLRDILKKIDQKDENALRFEAQLLRVGDQWSLLSATHELFAEFQLQLDKSVSTKHNMMLAYTNGCESYIPPDKDLELGGYEAATFPDLDGAAFRYRHRRAVRQGTERRVMDLLRSLWS